jgi:hypothetical protein
MAKSRQTRKSGSARRNKKAYRPGAPAGPRVQQDVEAAAQAAAVSKATSAGRATPVSRATPVAAASAATTTTNFAQEYHYVLGDLKRIAILAAVMFAILIILALVLT